MILQVILLYILLRNEVTIITIFKPVYNMFIELDKLEKLMPRYPDSLRFLSKTIRNKVWNVSNEESLAKMLSICNCLYSILIDVIGEDLEIIEQYVYVLEKNSDRYSTYNLNSIYAPIRAHISECITHNMVKEHWRQLNPYFRKEYVREDLFKKSLIDLLDDFFQNIITICPDEFLIPLSNFNYLIRGRRGKWKLAQDLVPPSIEFALANNIVNRWNPPEKRYLYLVNGNQNSQNNDDVCFEEMRIQENEILTIANFDVATLALHKKIFNLDFDDISRKEIFDFVNNEKQKQVQDVIEQIYIQNITATKENIENQIKLNSKETKKLISSFCGKLLLKEICDAIFTPLDHNEDNDSVLKDQCYKSFHILAEYFEKKNIAGIVFPSTRMRLLNQTGSNLVLFSVGDAAPNIDTYRIIQKQ